MDILAAGRMTLSLFPVLAKSSAYATGETRIFDFRFSIFEWRPGCGTGWFINTHFQERQNSRRKRAL
jgi:hypothetical protein